MAVVFVCIIDCRDIIVISALHQQKEIQILKDSVNIASSLHCSFITFTTEPSDNKFNVLIMELLKQQ